MKFRGSAVAVALSTDKLKLDELNGKMRLCEMLNEAWYNGKSFCTSSEHHECNGSAYHTGLREMPEDMRRRRIPA